MATTDFSLALSSAATTRSENWIVISYNFLEFGSYWFGGSQLVPPHSDQNSSNLQVGKNKVKDSSHPLGLS